MDNVVFEPINLKGIERVNFMNRTDKKYWFHLDLLHEILQTIQNQYYILTINSENQFDYATTYYDNYLNDFYLHHHNGKLNRLKIRRRTYLSSNVSFLEIKTKNNKGRTIKKRVVCQPETSLFSTEEAEFINLNTTYQSHNLFPGLTNRFSRITLINKNYSERCTIDTNLFFKNKLHEKKIDNLAIIEIKSDAYNNQSTLKEALNNFRIKSSGFSKYCIGRAILEPSLKRNSFKLKIRQLEKLTKSIIIQ